VSARQKVVIIGGGMAGLTTAWRLSRPGWQSELASITVYQRGGLLGGKGASTRGVHGRIEEHGLHVWLGYYHNAFRLLREVYDELDRPTTDPGCPILTFADAFVPASTVGVDDPTDRDRSHWIMQFGTNDLQPGRDVEAGRPLTVAELVRRSVQLIAGVLDSLDKPEPPVPALRGVFLTTDPTPPGRSGRARARLDSLAQFGRLLRQAEVASLIAGVEGLALVGRLGASSNDGATVAVLAQLDSLRTELETRIRANDDGRRLWQVVDLVVGCTLGAVQDGLLGAEGFARIDHLDFREWLASRVAPETLESPLVRGLYDLVFAYEDGDAARPRFSAGLGLFLASRLFFEYQGSIFWKMRAGMGDIVFVPLYQALRARGVEFRFFHRLDRLDLDATASRVEAVQLHSSDETPYEPLIRIRGLPCFPTGSRPRPDRSGTGSTVELRAGHDFDRIVLAVSVGILPQVAGELIERLPAWRQLVDNVRTVATQSLQVWARPTEVELGCVYTGATVSGGATPFDTYSSMSHLADVESWPDRIRPGSIGYFCGALPDSVAAEPGSAGEAVRRHVDLFLDRDVARIWPAAVAPDGRFRRELLCGGPPDGIYARANTDASDRYVQSLPGTSGSRLRADQSGLDNLVLAGDWTNCGLNAGCVEAAVMSGLQAANVVIGRPLTDGLAGRWYGLDEDGVAAVAARETG